ncbi:hypothetical protein [Vogesella sp. LIG4]|uniref:hypothetical protein n=1 Tax=Vogesella sp. LIG4 TaxID=1192162 RepID=UPI00081FF780|nr:hypothetical protein [Vogesella sp. LIG4]SCK21588.1 hypothetical protein PSELUDRAFT_2465 [Vogesella sp. LIG4]
MVKTLKHSVTRLKKPNTTINAYTIILTSIILSTSAFAGPTGNEYTTQIKCGNLTAKITIECQSDTDEFTPGHCKLPGILTLTNEKTSDHKIFAIPNLEKQEIISYIKHKTYHVLYPRVMSCATINNDNYLAISYYGNEKQNPWNELDEFYSKNGEKLTGKQEDILINYFATNSSKTTSKYVRLNSNNQ